MDNIAKIREAKAQEYQQYLLKVRARLLQELDKNQHQLLKTVTPVQVGQKRKTVTVYFRL